MTLYQPTEKEIYGIDGTDGTGKERQTEELASRLRSEGKKVKIFSFPRYDTGPGKLIRKLLNEGTMPKDPYQASLYYAVDRSCALPDMYAAFDAGYDALILDRYVPANMGHQGSRIYNGFERVKFFQWILDTEFGHHGLIIPRKTFILDLPPDIALQRMVAAGKVLDTVERDMNHQRRSHRVYQEIVGVMPGACLISCMEGSRALSIEEVHERIWEEIQKK